MNPTLTIISFLFISISFSQHKINGKIVDEKGKPIEAANIYLEGTIDGTTSNFSGEFSFTTEESGDVVLIVSFIGYKEFKKLSLVDQLKNLTIVLEEEGESLDEVTFTASSFSLGKSTVIEKMNPLDIVMTGSSNGDIYAALHSLPGTQKVGENGRLYVRGGEDRETQTFIDGMHVLVPYTQTAENTPARSRFSPFIFQGINLSLGGYESEYGQALSSVLPMETKDISGNTKLGIHFSPLDVGSGGTYSFGKQSLSGEITYTDLKLYNPIFPDRYNWKREYNFLSAKTQYKHEIGTSGIFKLYTGYDHTGFIRNIIDEANNGLPRSFDFNENNYYINSTYTAKTKSGYELFFGAAFSQVNNDIKSSLTIGDLYNENQSELHVKAKLKKNFLSNYKINVGVESYIRRYDNQYTSPSQVVIQDQRVSPNLYSIFVNNQIKIVKGLYVNASGRLEYSDYNKGATFSPRVSLNYLRGNFQLSGIFGKYFQTPENKIIATNQTTLDQESAIHYILGSSYNLDGKLIRLELYHKDYDHLILKEGEVYTSNGFGKSNGIDLYITDDTSLKNLKYTLSYSYNDSKRLYEDYPEESTPLFTTRHNGTLSIKYYIPSWKTYIGVSNTYASGRPYNNPNFPGFVNSKAKSFHSLDMNLTFLLSKKAILFTSLTNVLGRENIFGYTYASNPNADGIFERSPINVNRDRFFYIGLFISLKSDSAYDVSNF